MQNSSDGIFRGRQFRLNTDFAAPGDYDGDGRFDIAVQRETNGTFYILKSTDGTVSAT